VQWEASDAPAAAGSGWYPDPLDPVRLRWWDGAVWTARIARLEPGSDAISWRADIGELAAPAPLVEPPPAPDPPLEVAPVPRLEPVPSLADEIEQEDLFHPAVLAHEPLSSRRAWAVLAAAVVLLLVGAGVSSAMLGSDSRPTVARTRFLRYADTGAELALKYPEGWRVDKETEGVGVLFEIGPASTPPARANTVNVETTVDPVDLPPLHELANEATAQVVAEHPSFRLESATRTMLAGGPAFRFELVDPTDDPVTRIVQVIGSTESGRLLIVTATTREPRTAPTTKELRRFLKSISSS
jgi:hypothetical protein